MDVSGVSLHIADYCVMAFYFLVLVSFGFIFKKMNKDTKDYFAGGGSMLWWLVGATAFMTIFSSWTFTGAAGQAYNTGFQVAVLFFANALGYFLASKWTAPMVRQLNCITPLEIIRKRYGKVNEQVFTWVRFPITLLLAGTWLSSLGVFMSSAFGWEPVTAIIICGIVVTIMTLFGGSWAVIASDYLQMLVVMIVSITTAIVVVINSGGYGNVVESFNLYRPTQTFYLGDYKIIPLFVLWALFTIIRNVFSANNMYDSYRYLSAADSHNARKGARLASILMVVGAFIWFIPPWAAASLFESSTLAAMFPNLRNPSEAIYLVMVNKLMPVGMTGLLLAGVFAATMSSMDSALNTNTGIFIRNFLKPVLMKDAPEEKLLRLSKITIVAFGFFIVFAGMFINTLKDLTLFDIMLRISSLIQIPTFIPLVFGFYIKKVPDWAAWATLIVGALVSSFSGTWLNMLIEHFAMADVLTALEKKDLPVTFATMCHFAITLPFFLSTGFFYKETGSERDKERDEFFKALKTEVVAVKTPEQFEKYRFQRKVLGVVSTVAGGVIGVFAFLPAPVFASRIVLFLAAAILVTIGTLLRKSGHRAAKAAKEMQK